MEPLFEVTDKCTYDIYEEYVRVCTKKMSKFNISVGVFSILLLVYSVVCFWGGRYKSGTAFALIAIGFPIMVKMRIKKEWESNKTRQNVDIHFSFFEAKFIMKTTDSERTVAYENIYRIILSDKLIILMISRQQGACFRRSKCSEELLSFLHTVVPIEKWL